MSYPPPVYDGSWEPDLATFRPADSAPDLPLADGAAHFIATGALTAGRFGLYRWDMGLQTAGARPHFHRTISESFFVLSGAVELYRDGDWIGAGPGDFE